MRGLMKNEPQVEFHVLVSSEEVPISVHRVSELHTVLLFLRHAVCEQGHPTFVLQRCNSGWV